MRHYCGIFVIAVVVMVAACGNVANEGIDAPPADATPAFVASGTVVGPRAAAGPVVALWVAEDQSGDYLYKLGDGTASATAFSVGLPGDPPSEARLRGPSVDVGIAFVALLAPGASVPDGKVTSQPPSAGLTAKYAIIYRAPTDPGTATPWLAAFPLGLSCGRCVPATSGFDSFEPVDCALLVLDTEPTTTICNYT
jgi:hypothetical protein